MNMEDSDWLHSDTLDLLSSLDKTDLLEGDTEAAIGEGADLEASYYEAFTDLRDYLLGDNSHQGATEGADALWEPANVHIVNNPMGPGEILPQTLLPVVEGMKPVKRTASEAFEITEHLPTNPDHNDYILKAKKSRVVAEPEADGGKSTLTKAEKYVERRKKNNVASKRSRETRKQKFTEMELEAQRLERQNEELRQQVESLEAMAKQMKESLIQKLAH